MRLILVLSGIGAAAAMASATCNLGGELVDGRCRCYPTFTGSYCSKLHALPSKDSRALYRRDSSSWGGSVAMGDDGRYHMFFADLVNHCGLTSWECNSAVSHAVAPAGNPEGPFEFVEQIMSPWGCNPTLKLHNGTWIVYHIGTGETYKPLMECSDGVTQGVCGASREQDPVQGDTDPGLPNVIYSDSPDGPWTVQKGESSWVLNNPTIYINNDSSALAIYKLACNSTVNPDNKFCRQFAVATAESWMGPFKFHSRLELFGEDAHIWRCPFSGTFHLLFQGGSYTASLPQWNGWRHLAHSEDGFSWSISQAPQENGESDFDSGLSTDIALVNGSVAKYTKRERHQLLLDADGVPTHLFNGVSVGDTHAVADDFTLTSVQPLATRLDLLTV